MICPDLPIQFYSLPARIMERCHLCDDTPFPHIAAEPGAFDRTCTLPGPGKTESLSSYRLGGKVEVVWPVSARGKAF